VSVGSDHAAHSPRTFRRGAGVLRRDITGLFTGGEPGWSGYTADGGNLPTDDAANAATSNPSTITVHERVNKEDNPASRGAPRAAEDEPQLIA